MQRNLASYPGVLFFRRTPGYEARVKSYSREFSAEKGPTRIDPRPFSKSLPTVRWQKQLPSMKQSNNHKFINLINYPNMVESYLH